MRYIYILLFMISIPLTQAQERKVLGKINLLALCRGSKIRMMRLREDGDVWFFTTSVRGRKVQVIQKHLFSRRVKKFFIPIKDVNYASVCEDKNSAIVYQHQGGQFWHVDIDKQKSVLFMQSKKGRQGFGLYGSQRSYFVYQKNHAVGLGYLFNKKLEFEKNYLVRFDLSDLTKPIRYTKIMPEKRVIRFAKKYYPKGIGLGRIAISKKYLTFGAWDKKGNGRLIGINLYSRKSFVIDRFKMILGTAIHPKNKYLAYVKNIGPGKNALMLYNFRKKKTRKILVGRIFDASFNANGDKIGVGFITYGKSKKQRNKIVHKSIMIIHLKKKTQKAFPLSGKAFYPYWRFVKNDTYLILYDGKNDFYRLKIQQKKKK